MKKEWLVKTLIIGIILLFICMIITPSIAVDNVKKSSILISNGNTLYVGGSGSGNYSNIQSAIDDAKNGDTIFVYSGIYYEQIWLRNASSLSVKGEDKWTTIIDSKGLNFSTVNIFTTGNSLSNFTVQNAGYAWPYGCGIYLSSSNNVISNNRVISNIKCGIESGVSNTVTENLVYDNGIGINVAFFDNIHHNKIYNNSIGINLEWARSDRKQPNLIRWNNISNNDIGINFDSGRNIFNIISDNIISNNNHGIFSSKLYYDNNILIFENTISNNIIFNNNENGIYLNDAHVILNKFEGNQIYSNYGNGIKLNSAMWNKIYGNNISSNEGSGIIFEKCISNRVYGNNFESNKINGISIGNCIRMFVYKNVISNNKNVGLYLYSFNTFIDMPVFFCNHNNIKKNNFFNNSKNGYFNFDIQKTGKPLALVTRLMLIRSGNKWDGNFWDEPQIIPYKIEGSLGTWYYPLTGDEGGSIPGYYIDRHPATEPYNITIIEPNGD